MIATKTNFHRDSHHGCRYRQGGEMVPTRNWLILRHKLSKIGALDVSGPSEDLGSDSSTRSSTARVMETVHLEFCKDSQFSISLVQKCDFIVNDANHIISA